MIIKVKSLTKKQKDIIKQNKWYKYTGFDCEYNYTNGQYDLFLDTELFYDEDIKEFTSALGIEVA